MEGTSFADVFMVVVTSGNDNKATSVCSGVEQGDEPLYANFAPAVRESRVLVAMKPSCPPK